MTEQNARYAGKAQAVPPQRFEVGDAVVSRMGAGQIVGKIVRLDDCGDGFLVLHQNGVTTSWHGPDDSINITKYFFPEVESAAKAAS